MVENSRLNELVNSLLEDKDHGRQKMQDATVAESICLVDYIETKCIPLAKENKKENDLKFFEEYDVHYRMLTLDKIMKLDRYGIVISKATNHFYSINKDVIVLVDFSEADFIVDTLAEQNLEVEVREISNPEFRAMLEDLTRLGFNNVQFTDGRLRPLIIPKDTILKLEEVKGRSNPEVYIETLTFLQEAHKFAKEGRGVLIKKDSPIAKAVQQATLLVPAIVQSKHGSEMQVKYPFLNTNVEGQRLLPVATDHKEFEFFIKSPIMKDYNALPKEKKACIELPFAEIYRIFKTDSLFGITINPVGFNFIMNSRVMEVIAEGVDLDGESMLTVNEDEPPAGEQSAPKNKYANEETNDLRRKVLEHFIETQEGVIEKNKDIDTPEAKKKVEKAQTKLKDFRKQLEALDE
ncbi:MAG: hypothetical protein IJV39_04920 [Ruminococcus sp.]|nr:hypothetical protein [Ruminococcus sp.]